MWKICSRHGILEIDAVDAVFSQTAEAVMVIWTNQR